MRLPSIKKAKLNRFNRFPFGVYLLLLASIALFFVITRGTVSPGHLLNIVRQSSSLGVAAIGQTIVLLAGGLDLSVGSVVSMVNLVAASIMNGSNANIPLAIVISLSLCLMVGFINGFIIARFRMQPFLVTMAVAMMVEGGYFIYTKGIARGSVAPGLRPISEGWLGPIPIAGLIWLALWFIASFILHKSVYGKKLYITGGNRTAARLSGYRSEAIIISTYVICSFLAGIAGLLLTAYIGTASTGVGADYTLNSIAATVIGGTAFTGGIGSLEGTFPGVLITTMLHSILTIAGISEPGKFISQGMVIAIMVAINRFRIKNV